MTSNKELTLEKLLGKGKTLSWILPEKFSNHKQEHYLLVSVLNVSNK